MCIHNINKHHNYTLALEHKHKYIHLHIEKSLRTSLLLLMKEPFALDVCEVGRGEGGSEEIGAGMIDGEGMAPRGDAG